MSNALKVTILLALIVVVGFPGIGSWLESSMLLHMLVQLPVLAFFGWWLGEMIPQNIVKKINAWNMFGLAGVLLMSGAGLFWMLPSVLDASLASIQFLFLKIASMVLLIGMMLSITSKVWHPVLKGIFLLEAWAMLGRFGYGYLISPDRLCANYLFNEQQLLGETLLGIAAIWATLWSLKVFIGMDVLRLRMMG